MSCCSSGRCSGSTAWGRRRLDEAHGRPGPGRAPASVKSGASRHRRRRLRFRQSARDREDLDERRARGLGGRQDPRCEPRPPLRHRCLRRDPLLLDRARAGRLRDHLKRLETSAQLLYMRLPYSVDELRTACHETLAANGLDESYLRPIAYYGYGELGVHTRGNDVEVAILTFPWGRISARRTAERLPRDDLILAACRAEHDPAHGQAQPASTSTRCSRCTRLSAPVTTRPSS